MQYYVPVRNKSFGKKNFSVPIVKDCIFIGGNQLLECNLTQDNDINYTGNEYYLKDYSSNKHHIKTNLKKNIEKK